MNALLLIATVMLARVPPPAVPLPVVDEEQEKAAQLELEKQKQELERKRQEEEQKQREQKRVVRIAVRDIEVAGAEKRLGQIVTEALVTELRKLQRAAVITDDEVEAMLDLEAKKQLTGCETDNCLAEIIEALGADALVIGSITTVDEGERLFTLKVIDQKSARTAGQVSKRLAMAGGEECLALIGPAVEELFPHLPLKPGETRGVADEVALRLNPPPLSPWVFWTGAAVTGAALATGVAATVVNAQATLSAQEQTEQASDASPARGDALDDDVQTVRGSFTVLAAGYTAAVVVGAATTVAALFTDWRGDAAE